MFAFSHTDYIDPHTHYAARMPFYYAFRDAFGLLDVLEDSRATLKGSVSYRKYEPVEGGMHQGAGRERRIRAGLRYAKGGQQKYWLPMPTEESEPVTGPFSAIRNALEERRIEHDGYAPLLRAQEEVVVNERPMLSPPSPETPDSDAPLGANLYAFSPPVVEDPDADLTQIEFDAPDKEEDALYAESKKLLFGDYHYPCIDVSSEAAKKIMWDEEERILSDRRAAAFSPLRSESGLITDGAVLAGGRKKLAGYGAVGHTPNRQSGSKGKEKAGPSSNGFYHRGGNTIAPNYQSTPPILDAPDNKVIDMSPEASKPSLSLDGVQLNWTKSDRVVPGSPRRIKSPDSAASSQHLRPSLNNRGTSHSSASSQISKRSDAVDLVVEDPKAAQLEMTKERRKGEPAVRQTGQRKVYRTTYEVEGDSGDEKTVNVEHEIEQGVEDPIRKGTPEIDRTKVKVKDKRGEDESEDEVNTGAGVAEMTITRAATPPPHAIIEVDRMKSPFYSGPEDNPWA
ncbi:hypothetical protein FRC03_003975 [Tulasnella sp. 419]|nr:hypothetical protein FRC03_003975 [Tulasnella sp. 419]